MSLEPRKPDALLDPILGVLHAATQGLEALKAHLDPAVVQDWTAHISGRKGRVVLCGMGKSGLVAQKISATFASTGTPSFFLHPAEALHGDLGMVTSDDTALLLSNSGESEEVIRLLPSLLRMGVPCGAITGRADSHLAQAARWRFLYTLPAGEGCPLHFAPMASTTLQLVWGDMLAAARMVYSGFTLEGFAAFHPAGSLGARLLHARDLMHRDYPATPPEAPLVDVLSRMTEGRLGMTVVMEEDRMLGVVSDGDIRRAIERVQREGANPLDLRARQMMTATPVTIDAELLAIEAARLCEHRKITFLVVEAPGSPRPVGVLHIHDLLTAKVI